MRAFEAVVIAGVFAGGYGQLGATTQKLSMNSECSEAALWRFIGNCRST